MHLVDVDEAKVSAIRRGESYIEDVPSAQVAELAAAGRLTAGTDFAAVAGCDAIVICVPTPLSANREPDLSILRVGDPGDRTASAGRAAGRPRVDHLPGHHPRGVRPILEAGGLVAGRDFNLAMSPERIDPGRTDFTVKTTPKIVGGLTPACARARRWNCTARCIETLVPVSSCDAAELTKLLENIFRSVNIALVNELAMLCERMDLDVWEVVDAAATKPYGFMRFSPGPGWAGTACRSTRSTCHGAPGSTTSRPSSSSWPARSTSRCPTTAPSGSTQALNGHRKPVAGQQRAGARRVVQERRRRPPRVARPAPDRAAPRRGAEISYHDPHVPSLRTGGLELQSQELTDEVAPERRHRLRRHRPPGRRPRAGCAAGAAGDGLPQRRSPHRRQGGDAVSDPIRDRRCRSRLLGPEPGPQLQPAAGDRADLVLRCRRVAARAVRRASSPTPASRRSSTTCSPTRARRRLRRHARADASCGRQGRAAGRQARVRREAAGLDGGRGTGAGGARRAAPAGR